MRIEDAALLARPCARGGFSDRRHERAAVSRACRHGDRVEPSEDPVLVPPVSSYDDVGMGKPLSVDCYRPVSAWAYMDFPSSTVGVLVGRAGFVMPTNDFGAPKTWAVVVHGCLDSRSR